MFRRFRPGALVPSTAPLNQTRFQALSNAHKFPRWGDLECKKQLHDKLLKVMDSEFPWQLGDEEGKVSFEDAIAAMIAANGEKLEKQTKITKTTLEQSLFEYVYVKDPAYPDPFRRFFDLVKENDKARPDLKVVDPNEYLKSRWSQSPNVPRCPTWTDVGPTPNVVRGALSLDRFQSTGTCVLISLIIAHYLEGAKSSVPHSVPAQTTIDAAEYIRHHVRGEALQNYLNKGYGFKYNYIAKSIFDEPGEPEDFKSGCELELKDLPLVITRFEMQKDGFFHRGKGGPYVASNPEVFTNNGKKKIDTSDENPSDPVRHSMLIVGMQDLPNGGRLFLLKNWWPNAPYAVVDDAYLAASLAMVAKPAQPKQQTNFKTLTSAVATTQADAPGVFVRL